MLDINLSNVTLNYGFKNILDGVSFQINSGDKVAIVGDNGTGKTSIFNLISGRETPTSGTVSKRRDATVGFLRQIAPETQPGITVRDFLKTAYGDVAEIQRKMCELESAMADSSLTPEQLDKVMDSYSKITEYFSTHGGYEIDSNVEKMAGNLKITELLNQEYNSLSGGQKTIACLAQMLLLNPDILLLDEPTNHLDIPTLSWLEGFIKGYNGVVVLVSHDRYFLDKTVNKIFAIADGKIKTYFGNYTQYVEALAAEREAQAQAYVTQQKMISGMEDTIRKNRAWGAQSSEKAYRVAKQLERRIDEMEKVERPKNQRNIALNFNQETRSGNDVLTIEDLCFAYENNIIFCGANMNLEYQDRVCLLGKNGCGKSTLLKIVLGELPVQDGKMVIGSNVKIGYLPQHVSFEDEKITILQEFQKHFKGSLTQAYSSLAAFHFYGEEVHKRLSSLSGGEKVRLKFAKLVQNDVNLIILDEPTNHLDVRNREILEEALANFGGTVFFVSHDRYFINKVATRVVELADGELINYLGNYDFYHQHVASIPQDEPSEAGTKKFPKRK
jgi:ATP-binding cassette subfamily F protein 3